jgi:hypothetical protein
MKLRVFSDSAANWPAGSSDGIAIGASGIRFAFVKALCRPGQHVIVTAPAAGHRSGRTDIGVVEPEADIIHAR